mmetsp:Transcript_36794/g.118027  ORF Transcript_36794/g.118027 Transcript_36794/m.118027 type:complete len:290 (+) Transcript_36794:55-924(+)
MDGWQEVGRGRRRGRPRRKGQGCSLSQASAPRPASSSSPPRDLVARIARLRESLAGSAWWRRAVEGIRRATSASRIVCYGLGPIFESRNAQVQLAFVLSLAEALGREDLRRATKVLVFDPVLSDAERAFLADTWRCDEAPPVDRFAIDRDTLVFMPHCPHTLYCALVARLVKNGADDRETNLCRERDGGLEGLVLIGNSFRAYASRNGDLDPDFRAAVCHENLRELSLDPGHTDSDLERAFNDTALISWSDHKSRAEPPGERETPGDECALRKKQQPSAEPMAKNLGTD